MWKWEKDISLALAVAKMDKAATKLDKLSLQFTVRQRQDDSISGSKQRRQQPSMSGNANTEIRDKRRFQTANLQRQIEQFKLQSNWKFQLFLSGRVVVAVIVGGQWHTPTATERQNIFLRLFTRRRHSTDRQISSAEFVIVILFVQTQNSCIFSSNRTVCVWIVCHFAKMFMSRINLQISTFSLRKSKRTMKKADEIKFAHFKFQFCLRWICVYARGRNRKKRRQENKSRNKYSPRRN